MVVECPHCHVRVFVGSDDICPSCRHNVRDVPADATQTALSISPSAKMPEVCTGCGLVTRRVQKVALSRTVVTSEEELSVSSLLMLLLGMIIPFMPSRLSYDSTRRTIQRVRIRLPRCEACSKVKLAEVDTDFENGNFRIVVHTDFAARYRELNRREPPQ
jgi:hypothetical protein